MDSFHIVATLLLSRAANSTLPVTASQTLSLKGYVQRFFVHINHPFFLRSSSSFFHRVPSNTQRYELGWRKEKRKIISLELYLKNCFANVLIKKCIVQMKDQQTKKRSFTFTQGFLFLVLDIHLSMDLFSGCSKIMHHRSMQRSLAIMQQLRI